MNRRLFLQRAAILATGIVAADQLELLEKLTWKKKYWQGGFNTAESFCISGVKVAGEDLKVGDLVAYGEDGRIWKVGPDDYYNKRFLVKDLFKYPNHDTIEIGGVQLWAKPV